MLKFLLLLGGTIALRPYVFVFLGAYLLLATLHLGAGRARRLPGAGLSHLLDSLNSAPSLSASPSANTFISPPPWTGNCGWPGSPSWIPCLTSFSPMPAIAWP